jgi:hypothetical protein
VVALVTLTKAWVLAGLPADQLPDVSHFPLLPAVHVLVVWAGLFGAASQIADIRLTRTSV